MTPQRLHVELLFCRKANTEKRVAIAYLHGTLGDATYSKLHNTFRISQNNIEWLLRLKKLINELGAKAWIYKEGSLRNVSILETTAKFLSRNFDPASLTATPEKIVYVRGYFDVEGGVPRNPKNRFYIQFVQKDLNELSKVRNILEELGIKYGKIHNPSIKADPDYWRFFVRAQSYQKFIKVIGSWHPKKGFFYGKE